MQYPNDIDKPMAARRRLAKAWRDINIIGSMQTYRNGAQRRDGDDGMKHDV